MLTRHLRTQSLKIRPCAARNLASTVLKLGSTIPISDILRLIAIAIALEKRFINCFRKARSDLVEWFACSFDSQPIIFASFFEFQTREHLAETPIVTGSNGAFDYVSLRTIDTVVRKFYWLLHYNNNNKSHNNKINQ
jgi:hypothetical protein